MTETQTQHYFAQDGNYGNAEDIIIIDTENWSEEDWQEVEDAHETERPQIAQAISDRLTD